MVVLFAQMAEGQSTVSPLSLSRLFMPSLTIILRTIYFVDPSIYPHCLCNGLNNSLSCGSNLERGIERILPPFRTSGGRTIINSVYQFLLCYTLIHLNEVPTLVRIILYESSYR